MRSQLTAPLGCLAFLLAAGAARAQSVTTYVSGGGRDAGACPRTAPCRTLQFAYGQTAPGGEIDALDAGGYGALTITGPITVAGIGPGRAFIGVQPGGIGITVNAGSADAVILRGIEIKGSGDATSVGIAVVSVGSLIVSDAVIDGVYGGLFSTAAVNVTVSKSAFSGDGGIAIDLRNGGALVATGVKVDASSVGIAKSGGSAQVVNCTFTNNTTAGLGFASGATGFVKGSVFTGNAQGISVAGGTVRLDTTTITGNTAGINNAGGTVYSYQNNTITDATSGTISPATPD